MSTVSYSPPPPTIEKFTLANLLTPMQFRTVLLVACGLKNEEIGEFLGTTEHVIKNVLREIYDRTGCWNRVELALRYVHEVEGGLLDLGRLQRELTELEDRAAQVLHARPTDLLQYVN